eukprot:GEMP01034053.1.p1 GENE.GEMP01034053.1~~GEMP01034053.1.p1  ORF type:complete len:277 (+),score=89.47 GEMP01034053.1:165-995(+)
MKTKLKTVQGELFEVEVADEDTVKRVKEKVVESKPDAFVVDGMKLIFAGKILVDDKVLLSEYGVKETDFLVVMSTKKAPAIDPNLQRLMDMGFPKDQAENALQAAGNNPDIAAELLMGGDDGDERGEATAQAAAAPPTDPPTQPPAQQVSAPPGGQTAFPQMDQAAMQNPDMIQALLRHLAASNPEMFARVQQNPQEFVQFLNNLRSMPEQERMQMLKREGLGCCAKKNPGLHVLNPACVNSRHWLRLAQSATRGIREIWPGMRSCQRSSAGACQN